MHYILSILWFYSKWLISIKSLQEIIYFYSENDNLLEFSNSYDLRLFNDFSQLMERFSEFPKDKEISLWYFINEDDVQKYLSQNIFWDKIKFNIFIPDLKQLSLLMIEDKIFLIDFICILSIDFWRTDFIKIRQQILLDLNKWVILDKDAIKKQILYMI